MSHKNNKTVPKVARPALVILGILLTFEHHLQV